MVKINYVLENMKSLGLVNEQDRLYSITQKGLSELESMELKKEKKEYANMEEKRGFFICHASEDKEEAAKPLADALIGRGYTVWLDEYELVLGDDIPEHLSKGISMSDFGIVIMSSIFFEKYWPKKELNSFLTKEARSSSCILPIRHGLKPDEVTELYPLLGSRSSVSFEEGIDKVVAAIERAYHKKRSSINKETETLRGARTGVRRLENAFHGNMLIGAGEWVRCKAAGSEGPEAYWSRTSRITSDRERSRLPVIAHR